MRVKTWIAGTVFALVASTLAHNASVVQYDRASDQHSHSVFMREGGWCWFQDPRAIIHQGMLLMGSVQGNASGPALVGVYDLEKRQSLGNALMQDNFMRDDHNSPVFYVRPDDSVLAMYALHGKNKTHYYRVSKVGDPLKWGEEMRYEHDYPHADTVTYMNLCSIPSEGKLYNFFRGIEYNPSFITSTDHGESWGEPTQLIKDEVKGRHRPYARYVSDGVDSVHIAFTDAHPRSYGNSIYYTAFRKGGFYKADGRNIKDLKQGGPLRPSEAELVYQGSGEQRQGGHGQSAPRSAWTSSIVLDENEHPHIGYSLYLSNSDHRYRIASWDGSKWVDREVAFAGKCLYTKESSYTGLIAIDPGDPTTVLISTDVDPSNGEDGGGKHEIYRAKIRLQDDIRSIQWTAVTSDSPVRNLRPMIVRGEGYRVFAWLRGEFQSFTNYQLDVVGEVEQLD